MDKIIWRSCKTKPPKKDGWYVVKLNNVAEKTFWRESLSIGNKHLIVFFTYDFFNLKPRTFWNFEPVDKMDFWTEIPRLED